jgi:hypothetical protein
MARLEDCPAGLEAPPSADRVLRPSAAAGRMASLLLWTRERRCASPAAATAAAWGGAGLLQPHRAERPERRPREEVRAIDLQQQPSCWLCRRRISRAAPSCRATCGSSGRGGPLDEPPRRSESSPQARCCGAGSWHATGKGRGTPPERPEGCCSCWAGRNRCGFRASRPQRTT